MPNREYWQPPKMWNGETVFVIGGGPSLNDQDLSPIHDRPVLGINCAYQLGDWIDVTYSMDCSFLLGTHERDGHFWKRDDTPGPLYYHPAIKVSTCQKLLREKYEGAQVLKVVERTGIDTTPGRIAVNKHSGHGAINLAVNLGASRIVLLGFDMKMRGDRHNWHTDHAKTPAGDIYEERYVPILRSTVEPLRELGIEVLNASPDSALDLWPKVSLEKVVA